MFPELTTYIKNATEHGLSELEIKQNLLNAGWKAEEVEQAFAHFKAQENRPTSNHDEDMALNSHIRLSENLQSPATAKVSHSSPSVQTIIQDKNSFSEQNSGQISDPAEKPTSGWGKRVAMFFLIVLILGLAGGGAYAYIFYWQGNPDQVWNNSNITQSNQVVSGTFKFSYFDDGQLDPALSQQAQIQDIKLSLEGETYLDSQDAKNPQSTAKIRYTFQNAGTSLSQNFEYRLANQVFYLNVSQNPFLSELFRQYAKEDKSEWVRLDLNLAKEVANSKADDGAQLGQVFDENLAKKLEETWKSADIVKMETVLGREKIGDVRTLHFKNSVNKAAIREAFAKSIDLLAEENNKGAWRVEPEAVDLAKQTFNDLLDKLMVTKFETWIGIRDFKPYKIVFESNAPSLISGANYLLRGSAQQSRDAKRLSDIRVIANALVDYQFKHEGYPLSENGRPLELEPTSVEKMPEAPMPPDGGCNEYFNTYWYTPKEIFTAADGKKYAKSFELTFCLGSATAGYPPGIAKLTEMGIEAAIPCPAAQENCPSIGVEAPESQKAKTPAEMSKDFVDNFKFNGKLSLEANYSGYGQTRTIPIPENSYDLSKLLQGAVHGIFIRNPKAEQVR